MVGSPAPLGRAKDLLEAPTAQVPRHGIRVVVKLMIPFRVL